MLLRKNLLLKSRRPFATCFELSLPIVLFLLLAYIRSVYEIKTYGPFCFEQGALFPISTSFLWSEEGQSQVGKVCGSWMRRASTRGATRVATEGLLVSAPVHHILLSRSI